MSTLITCATSQIGTAVARKLSGAGALYITGRDKAKLTKLADECSATALELDFFDSASINQIPSSIQAPLDKLVFIIPRMAATTDIFPEDDQWREFFDRYFIKPLSLLKQLHQHGLLNRGCRIVCLGGLSNTSALSNYAMNNCLRLAWLGQMKSIALTLGKDKISVNTLSPGGVMTDSYQEKLTNKAHQLGRTLEEQMVYEVDNIPLGQYAPVESVCEAIAALLGPMATHMTGQNILLDGGFVKTY